MNPRSQKRSFHCLFGGACLTALVVSIVTPAHAGVIFSDSFNRANTTVGLGTNDNALGGTIVAPWATNATVGGDPSGYTHQITSNQFVANGNGFDSYINHNFTTADLQKKFSVEFSLNFSDTVSNNEKWVALELGINPANLGTGVVSPDVTDSTTPLGILFRADDKIVVWDNANNGSGGAAYAGLNTGTHAIRLEIESPTSLSGSTDNTMKLFVDNVQFANLRNQSLSSYNFGWETGSNFYINFESFNVSGGASKFIDDVVISSVPEPGTAVVGFAVFGASLLLRQNRRRQARA